MAVRPADYPKLPNFADDKYYKVQLWRTARYANRVLLPSAHHVVLGEVAKEIEDRIYTAVELPDGAA